MTIVHNFSKSSKRNLSILSIFILLITLASCSSNEEMPDERLIEKELYDQAQTRLNNGSYSTAIYSLEALESRFPFGRYAEQAQAELIYAYYMNAQFEASQSASERFINLHPRHAHTGPTPRRPRARRRATPRATRARRWFLWCFEFYSHGRLDHCNPTVIYGIKNFNGNITKKDLREKNEYNTYKINGLPRTPICSPSESSIRAASRPADSKFLFFVANNNGKHVFSTNYRDHVNAVNKYQKK